MSLFRCILLALAMSLPALAAAADVTVYYPPSGTLVEEDYVVVEGSVTDPDIYDLEVRVNESEESFDVRDFVFAEEVSLEPGLNTITVADVTLKVFYADGEEEPAASYKKVFGHYAQDDSCFECHEVSDEGKFVLDAEPGEICGWCHSDLVTGHRGKNIASVHRPVADGECLTCHKPHLSTRPGLMRKDAPDCRACHEETFARLDTERYVHGPLNLGNCRLCHRIHSSPEPALLVEAATTLCVQCHSEVAVKEDTPAELRPHTMIPEGECGACHQPHSSNHPRMMREASSRTCYPCHPEKTKSFHEKQGFSIYVCQKCHDLHRPKQKKLIVDNSRFLCLECHQFSEEAAFTHEFIREGGCFTCHSFHTSPLAGDIAGLCLACHEGVTASGAVHGGMPVAKSRCTGCHSPHQSSKRKLLYAEEHTPFRDRDCAACHDDPATPLEGATRGFCTGCHQGKDLAAAREAGMKIHPPFEEEDCSFCHASHTSPYPSNLAAPQMEICLQCHGEFRRVTVIRPKSVHEAVVQGACGDCHDPHLSEHRKFLRREMKAICFKCHESLLANADGETWQVPHEPVAEGKCRRCHVPHSSRREHLLTSAMPRGCRPCHTKLFGKIKQAGSARTHQPVAEGRCVACHDVHGSDGQALVSPEKARNLCRSCHESPGGNHHNFSPAEVERHAGNRKVNYCLHCHRPHASPGRKLLKGGAARVCSSCHNL